MANYYVIQFTEIIDGEVFHRFYNRDRYLFSELNPADATHFNDRADAEYYAELELCDPLYERICDYFEINVVTMNDAFDYNTDDCEDAEYFARLDRIPAELDVEYNVYKVAELTQEELEDLIGWERTECDKHMKQLKEILA